MELEGLLAAAHKGHDKERVVIGGTPKFKITWPKINKRNWLRTHVEDERTFELLAQR